MKRAEKELLHQTNSLSSKTLSQTEKRLLKKNLIISKMNAFLKISTDCLFFQDENIEFYAPSTSPMVPEIVVSQFVYLGY